MRSLILLYFSAMSLPTFAQQYVQKDLTDCIHGLNNYTSDRVMIPVTDVIGQGQLPNQKFQHVIAVSKDRDNKESVLVLSPEKGYIIKPSDSGSYVMMEKDNEGKCYRLNNPGYDCENLPLGFTVSPIQKGKKYSFDVKTNRKFFESAPLDSAPRIMTTGERVEYTSQLIDEQVLKVTEQLTTQGLPKGKQVPDLDSTLPKCRNILNSLSAWEVQFKSEDPEAAKDMTKRAPIQTAQSHLDLLIKKFGPQTVQGSGTSTAPVAKPGKPAKTNR